MIKSPISFQMGKKKKQRCAAEPKEPSSRALCVVIVFSISFLAAVCALLLLQCAGGKLVMLCERNVVAFSWGFINRLFFFSCNTSKYKFLVQVTSKDSSQMQATVYILFCLCKNEKQGVDISMSIFMEENCVEPAETGFCAQNRCLIILLEMSFYGTA